MKISQTVFKLQRGHKYMMEITISNVQRAVTLKQANKYYSSCNLCAVSWCCISVKFHEHISNGVQAIKWTWVYDRNHYLLRRFKQYSRLSLSRTPRDSLKYFEISVVRHIRFAELRKKKIWLTTFNKLIGNWTFEVRDILKILWKRGEIAP